MTSCANNKANVGLYGMMSEIYNRNHRNIQYEKYLDLS